MKRLRPGFSQEEEDDEIVDDENVEKDEEKDEVNFFNFNRFLKKIFYKIFFGFYGPFSFIFPCMAREATSSHM